jgi:hypothetical protein
MENQGFASRSIGTVSGVFFSRADADQAYDSLLKRGHTSDDISVLMSDETLVNANASSEQIHEEEESALSKAANAFKGVIISITSMISIPGLGIALSKKLQKQFSDTPGTAKLDAIRNSGVPDTHLDVYDGRMQEGGIIISVDPRNREEKRAIIKDFRLFNGSDILGDDGYTELG